jgi:hypothetical protein
MSSSNSACALTSSDWNSSCAFRNSESTALPDKLLRYRLLVGVARKRSSSSSSHGEASGNARRCLEERFFFALDAYHYRIRDLRLRNAASRHLPQNLAYDAGIVTRQSRSMIKRFRLPTSDSTCSLERSCIYRSFHSSCNWYSSSALQGDVPFPFSVVM